MGGALGLNQRLQALAATAQRVLGWRDFGAGAWWVTLSARAWRWNAQPEEAIRAAEAAHEKRR
jgi:hypothetical protein